MLLFKKIAANLLYPLPVCLELLVLGFLLLLLTRFERAGKTLAALGVMLLLVFSLEPVPRIMAQRLEFRYLPIQSVRAVKDVRYIVVLGLNYGSDPRLPPNSNLPPAALSRLVEGIRLHRGIPKSRLIFSGGTAFGSAASAEGYARVAQILGVERQDMTLVIQPTDTAEEAAIISKIVGKEPFLLVTSAMHMPRAVALFKKQGAEPIPSPADYRAGAETGLAPSDFFPSPENITTARNAWHEMMGKWWSLFRGEIQ